MKTTKMRVYNLKEAMIFFLENSSGSIICVKGNQEKKCTSYPEAEEFFNSKNNEDE